MVTVGQYTRRYVQNTLNLAHKLPAIPISHQRYVFEFSPGDRLSPKPVLHFSFPPCFHHCCRKFKKVQVREGHRRNLANNNGEGGEAKLTISSNAYWLQLQIVVISTEAATHCTAVPLCTSPILIKFQKGEISLILGVRMGLFIKSTECCAG